MGKREDVLRKVQAMLDKAGSTTFDAERDSFLAKADQMMAAYAIEQFELDMARPASDRERPEARVVEFPKISDWQVRWRLQSLFTDLARHCGVLVGTFSYIGDGKDAYKVVGYRSDIDWLEMLFLSIQLHMFSKIEPKPDPAKSEAENFGTMREAGMDYKRIFELMGWPWEGESKYNRKTGKSEIGHGNLTGESAKILRRVRKEYHDLCAAEGRRPGKGMKAETYRTSFIEGYVDRISDRLYEMKQARDTLTVGKGVVLANRQDDLKEAFFNEFPDRRPHEEDCDCDVCHYRNCSDESCERPRCVAYNRDKNKPVRYRAAKDPKVDYDARSRGSQVANGADLSGGRNNVSGVRGALK